LIDKLDISLSKYRPNPERIKILLDIIIFSLMSLNPVHSLKDIIKFYRLIIGIKKASSFITASKKITPEQANEMLKTIILSTPYSKNKFNK
jgi:hypothetical protein